MVYWIKISRFDTPNVQYTNLEIRYTLNLFGDSSSDGVLEQIQLCFQDGNFGQLS